MNRDDIVRMTNEVFVEEFEMELVQLLPDTTIFDDLGLDSLDTVDLIVALQKKFGVAIRGDERVRSIRTLSDLYTFVETIGSITKAD